MKNLIRILYLEDDKQDFELVKAGLKAKSDSFELTHTQTKSDFVSHLKRDHYDVILSDFNLPGFDGLSALSTAKKIRPEIPFIVVSGVLGDEKATEILKAGATDYLLKDNLVRLGSAVERAVKDAQDEEKRKHAEAALRENEMKLRRITNAVPGAVYQYCLFPDGKQKFLFVSQGGQEMFGFSSQELKEDFDRAWSQILPEDAEGFKKSIHQSAQTLKPWRYEFRIQNKDRREKWVRANSIPEPPRADGSVVWNGILTDISEQKDIEKQLLQSQKMEAVGKLAGGVAHDFNNLLTVIKGYSEFLMSSLEGDETLHDMVKEIYDAANKGSGLTTQLLAFSRRQVVVPKVVNLNTLILDLDKMLRRLIGEDIELATKPSEKLGRVKIDPAQMEQVLLNLAVNARDAMPRGGKLTIETANVHLEEAHAPAGADISSGDYIVITVRDNGCGISEDVKGHIFEPFYTTKEKGKGTGLGLSTCYGIIKQSGGHIQVSTEPGRGTTFQIYFPRCEELAKVSVTKKESKDIPKGSETILLVEDEDQVRKFAAAVLRKQGYQVLEAENGEKALPLVQQPTNGEIHLLVTDVVMPQMSGRELMEKVQKMNPDIKVLFISGYTDDAVVRHIVLEADVEFLQKPFGAAAFAFKVREVLNQ